MPLIIDEVDKPRNHIIVPDEHYYNGDNFRRCKALGKFIIKHKPDVIVRLGDMWDMPSLCVAPDTKLLKEDMTWVEASALQLGDSIVGFDESPLDTKPRKFRIGKVTQNTKFISAKGFKIKTTHGGITCSYDHKFFTHNLPIGVKRSFRTPSELKVGWRIASLGSDWLSYKHNLTEDEVGYLKGFLDGEGSYGDGRLAWSQNNGEVAAYVVELMVKAGFTVKYNLEKEKPKMKHYYIQGSYLDSWKALQFIRPLRLLPKCLAEIDGKTCSKYSGIEDAEILEIKEISNVEVVGLETNIGTYISNSLFSHNCSYEKGKKEMAFRTVEDDLKAGHTAEKHIFTPMIEYNKKRTKAKKARYLPLIVKLMGNHEDRVKRLLEYEPRWAKHINMDSFRTKLPIQEHVVPFTDYALIDGVYYSHYMVSGVQGRAFASARAMIAKRGVSSTMGHTHSLDHAVMTKPNGDLIRGLFAGCFQDPDTKGFGGTQVDNLYWNGIFMKYDVKNGNYDLSEISVERLLRDYS